MNRLRGVVILPPWARYWLMGLGVSWIVFGWSGGGVFWVTVIVFIGIWGILMGRRYVNVTLEPWSKERGIVVWGYRKKHGPIPPPRLVWDDAPPAPEPSAPAPEDAPPTTPAADEAMYRRPPPFPPPPHPESTPAADPTATVPSAAEPAVAADSTVAPSPNDGGRKICPDCAETVLSEARVCRYCGYRFEPADTSPASLGLGVTPT